MSDANERLVNLKTQAKNRRDLGRWERAADLLKQAIDLAEEEYRSAKSDDWRTTMESELADCWGMLGGVERRWALDSTDSNERIKHLDVSIKAYDQGYVYEQRSTSKRKNTYNMLNRLLVRLVRDPSLLAAGPREGMMDLRAEFEKLAEQIGDRATDNVWTAADMALVNVLLERQDAASAYAAFEQLKPPDFARQSAIDVVAPLAKLDLPMSSELQDAERRLATARRG
jgi:hypothetical protein